MKTIEYRTIDKSDWGVGPWQEEPDKKQWLDEETGYPCLIVRSPRTGALCGYVGIKNGHPEFNKEYGDVIGNYEVHGGLTFSNACREIDDESKGICHVSPDEDEVWWLGFDCAHFQDRSPGLDALMRKFSCHPEQFIAGLGESQIYRDWEYVVSQVESLAKQLKKIEVANAT